MYDSIIIGTGPAGLSAALNLKTYKKDFIWFGSKNLSEKVQKAEKITNYPGLIIPELSEPPVRILGATIPENESHIFR